MCTFIYKSSDYTFQTNNSNTKSILVLKYPTSLTALVLMCVNTGMYMELYLLKIRC